ncbi:hypothetical protein THAOC_21259 [Thalassiosira oceanica]|uniref:Uncharacterized protein n=1 Tax=Thalassiosira oceanica TaxID=159749 RepID=K0SJG2_THAOC|nr:hypothetical protein THAOC_21259 [Thalassiosira oceanica]|eukprot:EJK58602.1 hypothetical protein THAOC_21259 [Thalassiosira oceanica]
MIQHDASLDPHWSALCQGFYGRINPHGTGINIALEGIQLNKDVMVLICGSLSGRNVREIAFTRIEFTNIRAAIQSLRTMLRRSSLVQSLEWSGIPIESVDDMALFVQMISERHSVLEKLDFGWNGDGNAQALLAGVDLSKYKSLDFDGNNIQTNGRADIPNLIASNSQLEWLHLGSNNLNDDDAVLIAESLSQNSNLKELYLNNNNIHQRGKSALLRAMKDTSSMNALSDSNHTCEVAGLNLEERNYLGPLNRAFKIHNLMVERYRSGEGNVPYFNREMNDEGSVVLAPFVMESVHRRHTAIKERYGYKVRGGTFRKVGKTTSEAQHQGEFSLPSTSRDFRGFCSHSEKFGPCLLSPSAESSEWNLWNCGRPDERKEKEVFGTMRSENDGNKRPRGNEAARTVAEADVTSRLADLESMLGQALGRIGSLEKKNKSMERETRALREDMDKVKDENRALKWSLTKLAGRVKKSWEYPEEDLIQPDEYWHSRGFNDSSICDLNEDFISRVRSAVSGLIHGVCDRVCIGTGDEDRMILHNAALNPHWRALCQSFYDGSINPHGTGMDISFETIQLDEVMSVICDSMSGRNIREVAFTGIEFTNMRAAIQSLRNMLKRSPQVKSLVWSGIPIESADDMALFVQMISERHSVLEKLDFGWNGDGNTHALLAGVDLSKYKRLNFLGNDLQTNGRADIPNLIASNSPLEWLHLEYNNLNDDDAVLIAESLSQNSNLKALYLDGNNIHQRGKSALLRAMKDTSSMNALSDSNHTCRVVGLNFEEINYQGPLNRAFKIHDLIVERYRSGEGNVPYFNREMDDKGSVVLAPFIMESVHRRHTAIKEEEFKEEYKSPALGLLYELVTDWKMPELFSFNKCLGVPVTLPELYAYVAPVGKTLGCPEAKLPSNTSGGTLPRVGKEKLPLRLRESSGGWAQGLESLSEASEDLGKQNTPPVVLAEHYQ